MFKNPQLISEWKKLTGEDAHPLFAEEQERGNSGNSQGREVIAFFNKIGGSEPLPARR